jgi:hypothetical protein
VLGTTAVDVLVDNDVVAKAVRYGLADQFWNDTSVGVLGAARFVIAKSFERENVDRETARKDLDTFLARASVVEPTANEVDLAAEVELVAQREGLLLHGGESQLSAIAVERGVASFETGDKHAIAALEQLLEHVDWIARLSGKVRCLEQIVLRLVSRTECEPIALAVCAEPRVDVTLSICFSCFSDPPVSCESAVDCLESYVAALRSDAPRILASS